MVALAFIDKGRQLEKIQDEKLIINLLGLKAAFLCKHVIIKFLYLIWYGIPLLLWVIIGTNLIW